MSNDSKTLKYLYSKLYHNKNLNNLLLELSRIKKLDDYYKRNFKKYDTFDEFEKSNPAIFADFKKSKSAYKEIINQFNSKNALQPCILTECFVAQTIANILDLNEFVDLDNDDNIPSKITRISFSSKRYTDGSAFRYCFYNKLYDAYVFQCGASSTIDIVFTKYNNSIRIEVKEQTAKLEECDITGLYDENGKLNIDNRFQAKRQSYKPFIDFFNYKTTVFDMEGHNFNFNNYLDDNSAKKIISDVLNIKVIDMFIFVVNNKIVPVLPDYLFDFVMFKGSEIRMAGRNKKKVFTPNKLIEKIYKLDGKINGTTISLPYVDSNNTKGRGLDNFTRYSIGSLFFVPLEDTKRVNNNIEFEIDKVFQKVPSISIHLNAVINDEILNQQHDFLFKNN